jgi:hypothetical protein
MSAARGPRVLVTDPTRSAWLEPGARLLVASAVPAVTTADRAPFRTTARAPGVAPVVTSRVRATRSDAPEVLAGALVPADASATVRSAPMAASKVMPRPPRGSAIRRSAMNMSVPFV